MSHRSPTGFAFSVIFEIAAVVIIVSLLPRFDLRPAATAAQAVGDDATSGGNSLVALMPSFEQASRNNSSPASFVSASESSRISPPAAPPLIARQPATLAYPATPAYVEERLDRASQQLVNSVGSAVIQATGELFAAPPPPAPPPLTLNRTHFAATGATAPERRVTLLPPTDAALPPAPSGSFPTQPRPWIRY